MKYKLNSSDDAIDIEVIERKDKQKDLLQAFRECQEGRCSCPTQEYSKLESLEIESDEASIRLKLKSKPGEQFDPSEIGRCLEYTQGKLEKK